MAKLDAVLTPEAHTALPEVLRGYYVESNGQFVLDTDVETHPNATKLRNSVQATRVERDRLETELKRYKEIGDVDKAKEALAQIQKLEEDKAKAAGNFAQLEQQLKEKHKQEQEALNTQLAAALEDIQTLVVRNQVLEVLGAEDVKGNSKILLPHILRRVKAEKVGGEWVPKVHDGQGNPQFGDGQGTPMTIKQLALEMKKDPDFAPNFASTTRSGSGTPPGAAAAARGGEGGGGVKTQVKKSDTAALSAPGMIEKINKGEVEVVD